MTSKAEAPQGVAGAEEVAVSCVALSVGEWAVLHVGRDQGCVVP